MAGIANKLQSVLDAEIGKGNVYNVVAAVQSHDRSIDSVGSAATADRHTDTAMTLFTPYFIANSCLLGTIIESVAGKPIAANLEEMIFVPLGSRNTYLFDWTASYYDESPATIYFKKAPAIIPKHLPSNVSNGGLVFTILLFLGGENGKR